MVEEAGAAGAVPPDPNVVTIPSSTTEVKPGEAGEFKIPADYQDRAYLKDVGSYDDVFKKLDGAQKLIGQRPVGVPGENATPDELTAFNKAMGVPDDFSGYTLKSEEGAVVNETLDKGFKELFHKAGLNQKHVDILQPGFEELTKTIAAEIGSKSDAEFDKLAVDTFGDKKDQVLADVKKIMGDNKPANVENFDTYLDSLNNKDLVVMSAVINNIKEKYIKEDSILPGGSQTGGDVTSLRQEAVKLMGQPEYADKFHKDHKVTFNRIQEIYANIGKLQAAGK